MRAGGAWFRWLAMHGRARVFTRKAHVAMGRSPQKILSPFRSAMRLKSAIWVSAYLRRRHIDGTMAVVRRRGAEEAGAVFIKIDRLDGGVELYGPAPQTAFDEAQPSDRAFSPCFKHQPVSSAEADAYLDRQIRYDPDLWIIEVEDRRARHLLDHVVG